jgi:chromosome segregation ATPase
VWASDARDARGVTLAAAIVGWIMKNTFLTNLLVVFALGLCGLCTFQWLRETENRKEVQKLHNNIYGLQDQNMHHTNRIAKMDAQIADLTDLNKSLHGAFKQRSNEVIELRSITNSLSYSNDVLGRTLDAYTNAFAQTTNRLAEAYENIKRQNELITNVVAQRDEYVNRLNLQISNYNILVGQHNEAVRRVEELQNVIDTVQAQQEKKRQQQQQSTRSP